MNSPFPLRLLRQFPISLSGLQIIAMPRFSTTPEQDTASNPKKAQGPILFFDGQCGLCNQGVTFLIGWDRHRRLQYASLQGETAQELLTESDRGDLNSMVLAWQGRLYRQSAAGVRVLWILGGLSALAGALLWCVPKPIRDLGYRLIARNRYRFLGKATCRLPRPGEEQQFLP